MGSRGWYALLVTGLALLLLAPTATAIDPLTIDAPHSVGYYEPFTVSLKIDDDYIQKNTDTISVGLPGGTGGSRPTVWSSLPLNEYWSTQPIEYKGEKVINFQAKMFTGYRGWDKPKTGELYFSLKSEKKGTIARVKRNITILPVKADITLPHEFTWDGGKKALDPFWHTITGEYKKISTYSGVYNNAKHVTITAGWQPLTRALELGKGSLKTRANDLTTGKEGELKPLPESMVKKHGGQEGYYRVSQRISGGNIDPKTKERLKISVVRYSAVIFTKSSYLKIYWSALEEGPEGSFQTHLEETKKEAEAAFASFRIEKKASSPVRHPTIIEIKDRPKTASGQSKTPASSSTTSTTQPPSGDCQTDLDCPKGEKCSACHKCTSKPLLSRGQVKVKWSVQASLSKDKIKNSVQEEVEIRGKVTPTITDQNGNVVDLCDVRQPGPANGGVAAQARMANIDHYAGIYNGRIRDERAAYSNPKIVDLEDGETTVSWPIRPDSRKKVVGAVFEQYEPIVVVVQDNDGEIMSNQVILTLQEAGPLVEFDMEGKIQAQQGTSRAIKMTITDEDSRDVTVKSIAAGFGHISYPKFSKAPFKKTMYQAKTGEEIIFAYHAPSRGNFDIGKAIAGLSMWNLQKDALKQSGKDLLALGAGEAADKLVKIGDKTYKAAKAAKNVQMAAGKTEKALDLMKNTYEAGKYAKNLNRISNGLKAGKGVYDSNAIYQTGKTEMERSEADHREKGGKTTLESGAEWGITAINVVQMGVTALTFVPNKIPGVNLLTLKVQAAVAVGGNTAKADLKYIAQVEKVNRAREIFLPEDILVIVEDESGWQAVNMLRMKVAYHEI